MNRVKRLFSAWRHDRRGRTEPPPPDSSVPVTVDGRGERIVEVVSSPGGLHRIGIARDRAGLYRLYAETWAQDWDSLRQAMWFRGGPVGGLSDDLERARSLAQESLAGVSPR
jgi:hypothetical protein